MEESMATSGGVGVLDRNVEAGAGAGQGGHEGSPESDVDGPGGGGGSRPAAGPLQAFGQGEGGTVRGDDSRRGTRIDHSPLNVAGARTLGPASNDAMEAAQRAVTNWQYFFIEYARGRRLCNGGAGRRILVNCGGLVCVSYESHLRRFPGTVLTDMLTREGGQLTTKNYVFFDRHPFACVEILNAYRDGYVAHQPPHITPEVWQNELAFFRFNKSTVKIEGSDTVFGTLEGDTDEEILITELFSEEKGKPPEGTLRLKLWNFFEDPKSSWLAWAASTLSLVAVVVSVTIVLVETLPDIKADLAAMHILEQIDFSIVVYFTFEYFSRLLLTTEKVVFVCRTLNVIDLISIIPTWVSLGVSEFSWGSLLRVLRVLRVFKLARHSGGLQVLAETAIAARNELFQVFFCFSILVILFATVVYYTEEQDPAEHLRDARVLQPQFESIPHSMWWAVITLCTIGYGDMVPNTGLGLAVNAMACVAGVVMVALPISVISSTFTAKFQEHTERQKLLDAQGARLKDKKARERENQEESFNPGSTGSFARRIHSAWVRRVSMTSSLMMGGGSHTRAAGAGTQPSSSRGLSTSLDIVTPEMENAQRLGGSINVFQRALSAGAAARTDAENASREPGRRIIEEKHLRMVTGGVAQ